MTLMLFTLDMAQHRLTGAKMHGMRASEKRQMTDFLTPVRKRDSELSLGGVQIATQRDKANIARPRGWLAQELPASSFVALYDASAPCRQLEASTQRDVRLGSGI